MLSKRENERLTRVGPGTPAGELLRRYWHPVAVAAELKEKPIKRLRILGEDLVLYRGESGTYGLVEERCCHRGASLAYGRIEGDNIRCPYHGWLFAPSGKCLEQPAEPASSTYKDRVRQPAYPVQKMAGLLYAYLGPKPAPLLPRYDVLVRTDGQRRLVVLPQLDCNWLQPMENSVDPTHNHYLHSQRTGKPVHGDREAEIAKYDFELFEHGIMKKRFAKNGDGKLEVVNQHPLVFPNMLRQHHGKEHYIQYRVPVDDTHTLFFEVYFIESADRGRVDPLEDPPVEHAAYHKSAEGVYRMDKVWMQDYMAWETAGPIYDRTREHLASGDRGILIFRKLLKSEIDKVRRGRDPLGVVRDPKANELIRFDTITDTRREVWKGR
ncbi:MAG TPA: Rieske 2Fe-2S domain-containing protein [Candidatus Acidoferrales bacterium]|nr:Rieske 2Fe-2S domain-containing protein [Candidatus Acidoferrales bacterium]